LSLLSIEGVSKEYHARGKRVVALDSINLDITESEFVTIVGPSGCGKSTMLNLIVGLLRASSGRITFRGAPIDGICTKIGYVTQKDNLLPWRTLVENVEIALEIRGIDSDARRSKARDFIDRVGLSGFEEHYPHELSGGMRQRANIIRTLIYDPELILMDEPFGPLDAQTRIVLQDQLLKLWSACQYQPGATEDGLGRYKRKRLRNRTRSVAVCTRLLLSDVGATPRGCRLIQGRHRGLTLHDT
jgi:NitT/TauT family transport system ATP-binding protein